MVPIEAHKPETLSLAASSIPFSSLLPVAQRFCIRAIRYLLIVKSILSQTKKDASLGLYFPGLSFVLLSGWIYFVRFHL
jgi:hypothetical protein